MVGLSSTIAITILNGQSKLTNLDYDIGWILLYYKLCDSTTYAIYEKLTWNKDRPSMVVHICNPSTQEANTEDSQVLPAWAIYWDPVSFFKDYMKKD
jgi:hypothetical protein